MDALPHSHTISTLSPSPSIQKPFMLQGHDRSITTVQYNREGDLLFSTSKDATPQVWWVENGERLGTYDGHQGTVWDCAVDFMTERLLTASADNTARLWEVQTGVEMAAIEFPTPVRVAEWAEGNDRAMFVSDRLMGHDAFLRVYRMPALGAPNGGDEPELLIDIGLGQKCKSARFSALNTSIYAGMEDGTIRVYDTETQEEIGCINAHKERIHDFSFNDNKQLAISASKDRTAKLWDVKSHQLIQTYTTENPVNSAKISPLYDHVILGGGQDAMSVTTTSASAGKFQVRFFHAIYGEELGGVTGHFGPINYLDFSPDGHGFTSGGEDGYVRIHKLPKEYDTQALEFRELEAIAAAMQ